MSLLSDLAKIQRLLAYRQEIGKNVEPSAFVQDLIEDKTQRSVLQSFLENSATQDPSLLKVGGRRAVWDLGDNVGKIDLFGGGPLEQLDDDSYIAELLLPFSHQRVFPSGHRAEVFPKVVLPPKGYFTPKELVTELPDIDDFFLAGQGRKDHFQIADFRANEAFSRSPADQSDEDPRIQALFDIVRDRDKQQLASDHALWRQMGKNAGNYPGTPFEPLTIYGMRDFNWEYPPLLRRQPPYGKTHSGKGWDY